MRRGCGAGTRRPAMVLLFASLPCALLSGCSDATAPGRVPTAATLGLSPTEVTLYVPNSQVLTATVRDQSGQPMSVGVAFSTRDSTTAVVTQNGTITAVEIGETWILAEHSSLRDSARVIVRYETRIGEARIRIRSQSGADVVRSWDSQGAWIDYLGGEDRDHTSLRIVSEEADTGLILIFRSPPEPGTLSLLEVDPKVLEASLWLFPALANLWDPTDSRLPASFGYVSVQGPNDATQVYAGTGVGALTFDQLDPPAGMGTQGRGSGLVTMQAGGFSVIDISRGADTLAANGDTLSVRVEFSLEYAWLPRGTARVTLTGPVPELSDASYRAWWWLDSKRPAGEGVISMDSDPYYPWHPRPHARLYRPAPGIDSMDASEPGQHPYLPPYVRIGLEDPPFSGIQQGGTVQIFSVVHPRGGAWGEMSGQIDAPMRYYSGWPWSMGEVIGDGTLSIEFHVPIEPEHGWAAPDRARSRSRIVEPAWMRIPIGPSRQEAR